MQSSPSFLRISRAIQVSGLLCNGETLVVGVSGGPDSTGLLEILCRLAPRHRWTIHAAHLNHLLRGEASDRDETFIRRWAQRQRIPFHCERTDTAVFAKERRLGLEDAARQIRYGFFE